MTQESNYEPKSFTMKIKQKTIGGLMKVFKALKFPLMMSLSCVASFSAVGADLVFHSVPGVYNMYPAAWPDGRMKIVYDIPGQSKNGVPFNNSIERAIQKWNAASDHISITSERRALEDGCDEVWEDGIVTVDFRPDLCDAEWGDEHGVATFRMGGSGIPGKWIILEGQIRVKSTVQFSTYDGRYRKPEITRLMLHEIGHTIGFAHVSNRSSSMYWHSTDADTPSANDILGLELIYPDVAVDRTPEGIAAIEAAKIKAEADAKAKAEADAKAKAEADAKAGELEYKFYSQWSAGNLESLQDGDVVSGITTVSGFLVSRWEDSIPSSINVDGKIYKYFDSKLVKRPDVAAQFPDYYNAVNSGFSMDVDWGQFEPGEHTVEVVIETWEEYITIKRTIVVQ